MNCTYTRCTADNKNSRKSLRQSYWESSFHLIQPKHIEDKFGDSIGYRCSLVSKQPVTFYTVMLLLKSPYKTTPQSRSEYQTFVTPLSDHPQFASPLYDSGVTQGALTFKTFFEIRTALLSQAGMVKQ